MSDTSIQYVEGQVVLVRSAEDETEIVHLGEYGEQPEEESEGEGDAPQPT